MRITDIITKSASLLTTNEGHYRRRYDFHDDFDGYLYHATPSQNVEDIRANGFRAGSYWGTFTIASYYGEDISDNGDKVHMFMVPLSAFNKNHLVPDYNGIEEPLTYTLGMSEEDVHEMWYGGEQTWKDCLELIGSVRYEIPVPPSIISDID